MGECIIDMQNFCDFALMDLMKECIHLIEIMSHNKTQLRPSVNKWNKHFYDLMIYFGENHSWNRREILNFEVRSIGWLFYK